MSEEQIKRLLQENSQLLTKILENQEKIQQNLNQLGLFSSNEEDTMHDPLVMTDRMFFDEPTVEPIKSPQVETSKGVPGHVIGRTLSFSPLKTSKERIDLTRQEYTRLVNAGRIAFDRPPPVHPESLWDTTLTNPLVCKKAFKAWVNRAGRSLYSPLCDPVLLAVTGHSLNTEGQCYLDCKFDMGLLKTKQCQIPLGDLVQLESTNVVYARVLLEYAETVPELFIQANELGGMNARFGLQLAPGFVYYRYSIIPLQSNPANDYPQWVNPDCDE
jgi:hypothetical protein